MIFSNLLYRPCALMILLWYVLFCISLLAGKFVMPYELIFCQMSQAMFFVLLLVLLLWTA